MLSGRLYRVLSFRVVFFLDWYMPSASEIKSLYRVQYFRVVFIGINTCQVASKIDSSTGYWAFGSFLRDWYMPSCLWDQVSLPGLIVTGRFYRNQYMPSCLWDRVSLPGIRYFVLQQLIVYIFDCNRSFKSLFKPVESNYFSSLTSSIPGIRRKSWLQRSVRLFT